MILCPAMTSACGRANLKFCLTTLVYIPPSYLLYYCQLNKTKYKHRIEIQAKIITYNPSTPPTIIEAIHTLSITVFNLGSSDTWRHVMLRIREECEECFSVLSIRCQPSCPIITSVISVIILKI